jgi:hypothetical protein
MLENYENRQHVVRRTAVRFHYPQARLDAKQNRSETECPSEREPNGLLNAQTDQTVLAIAGSCAISVASWPTLGGDPQRLGKTRNNYLKS